MRRLALAGLLGGAWLLTGAATWLQFESRPADGAPGLTVTGLLREPEGEGPFPAAILLADCDGISPHEREWGVRFAAQGYMVYLLDSFFTRGIDTTCDGTPVPVMDDLRGAIARLATLGIADMERVVVVGWQSGGDVALDWAAEEGPGIAVAFYPTCAGGGDLRRPVVLVLPELYGGSTTCNDDARVRDPSGVVPLQRIAPDGVGAGFDCAACEGGYLDGPGGWNEAADALVGDRLFGEIARLLAP